MLLKLLYELLQLKLLSGLLLLQLLHVFTYAAAMLR
jgi:hypothetical protein